MKLSSKVKTLLNKNVRMFERNTVLERLQSMMSVREKERESSYYGYLCDVGTCYQSDL
jgi:hypothetical protein